MAGPWENYQKPSGPWDNYATSEAAPTEEPKPWERYGEKPSPGIIGYSREALKQFALGGAQGIGSALKGFAGYGEREAGRELESSIEMAQRGILPGADEPVPPPRPAISAAESPFYKAGEAVEKSV